VADVEARIVVTNVDEARAVLELAEKALESTRKATEDTKDAAATPSAQRGKAARDRGRAGLSGVTARRLALRQSL